MKYEHVYLHEFENVARLRASLNRYLREYNYERWHQGLANQVPAKAYGK